MSVLEEKVEIYSNLGHRGNWDLSNLGPLLPLVTKVTLHSLLSPP